MRTFLAFWSFLLLSGFLGVAVAEEDDPFGTDSIFFFNVMSAAESEFYCKNKKLSAELRSASAEMMQAEVRARGDEGSIESVVGANGALVLFSPRPLMSQPLSQPCPVRQHP